MKRREFVMLVGCAAAAWPHAAIAQQTQQIRRIGILLSLSPDPELQTWVDAFLQTLARSGWTAGQNIQVEIRWARGNPAEVRRHAAELVALAPDVILAHGASVLGPLLQATRTVPVVFPIASDPVGSGFVESLARPGGNATGFLSTEFSMAAKWLELLKEIAPSVTRVAVLRDATQGAGMGRFAAIQTAAPSLRVEVTPVNMRDAGEIERGLAAFARAPGGGLVVTGGAGATALPRSDRCACGTAQAACDIQ